VSLDVSQDSCQSWLHMLWSGHHYCTCEGGVWLLPPGMYSFWSSMGIDVYLFICFLSCILSVQFVNATMSGLYLCLVLVGLLSFWFGFLLSSLPVCFAGVLDQQSVVWRVCRILVLGSQVCFVQSVGRWILDWVLSYSLLCFFNLILVFYWNQF